jgi:drug/metabolite transporter (DMT)-like permease
LFQPSSVEARISERTFGEDMFAMGRLRDWGLLLICNLIWGGQFVVYKIVQKQVSPVVAVLFPMTLATLLLMPIVRYERRKNNTLSKLPARDIGAFVLIGILGQVVAQLFTAWGVKLTPASNAALLALIQPVTTAFMAFLILNERMTTVRWVSFAFALLGVVECSGIRWEELDFNGGRYLLGNFMIFLSIVGSAFYNSYSKKLLTRYSPLQVILYSYYVFVLFMLPIAIYTEPEAFRNVLNYQPQVWLGLALLAVLNYFLAMVIFLIVLTRLDATQAALSNYLIPLFGVLTAAVVLHERLTKFMVVGGILVLASTLLMTIYEERQRIVAEAAGSNS